MRIFAEPIDGGPAVEITATADGRLAVFYTETMISYGLSTDEIEEDIGGGERAGIPFDGLVPWACEAVIRGYDIYLGDPRGYASR